MELAELHTLAKRMTPDQWCKLWIDFAGGEDVGVKLPPFPDESIQQLTNGLSGAATMAPAALFYTVVQREISGRLPDSAQYRLLDFGAGWGRITRLMLRPIHPSNLYAVDVDQRLVHAGKTALPAITFEKIESGAGLPFADGSFDIVISNSVFSHLSEKFHLLYVNEIARVLNPGGLFLGTTLGVRHLDGWLANEGSRARTSRVLGEENAVRQQLAAGLLAHGDTGRWSDYGLSIVPGGWVAKHWAPMFNVVATRSDYTQDVNVAIRA